MSRAETANQLRELADALSQRLEGSQGKETRQRKVSLQRPPRRLRRLQRCLIRLSLAAIFGFSIREQALEV